VSGVNAVSDVEMVCAVHGASTGRRTAAAAAERSASI
jgi:hypothetical protein